MRQQPSKSLIILRGLCARHNATYVSSLSRRYGAQIIENITVNKRFRRGLKSGIDYREHMVNISDDVIMQTARALETGKRMIIISTPIIYTPITIATLQELAKTSEYTVYQMSNHFINDASSEPVGELEMARLRSHNRILDAKGIPFITEHALMEIALDEVDSLIRCAI